MACNDNPRLFPQWRWRAFGLSYRKIMPQWSDDLSWFFILAVIASSYVASMIVPTVLLIFWPNCSDICVALLITLGVRLSLICRVLLSIENTPLGCLIILDGQNFPPLSRHLPAKNRRVGRYYAYIKLGYPYKPSHLPACFRGRVHSSLKVITTSASTADLTA